MLNRKHLVVFVAVIGLIFIAIFASADLPRGTKAPDFKLPNLAGKTTKLSTYFVKPGNVVILDIWATWCPPCRAEIPQLVKLQKSYKGKPVKILGVSIDDEIATVKGFARENKINYTVCNDPSGKTISKPYKVEGIPATYILDRKGVIRFTHSGFPSDTEGQQKEIASIKQEIKSLL